MAHMLQVVKMEETPLVDAAPSEAMWAAIAASLDIDRAQQAALMQHRHRFYSALGTLLHDHITAANSNVSMSQKCNSIPGIASGWTYVNSD